MNGRTTKRHWNKGWQALIVVVALIPAQPAWSQRNQFRLTEPLIISTGVEDVINRVGSTSSEPLFLVGFGGSFLRTEARSNLRVTYRPVVEALGDGHTITSWNHFLDSGYTRTLDARSGVGLGFTLVNTSDPSSALIDTVFALPRSDFREYATAATVYRHLTRRTTVAGRFDNSITRVSADEAGLGIDLSPNATAGTVGVTRQLSERQRIGGSYSALNFSPFVFRNDIGTVGFLASVPIVRGAMSRYAMLAAESTMDLSFAPSGLASANRVFELTTTDVSTFPIIAAGVTTGPLPPPSFTDGAFSRPFHSVILSYARSERPDLWFEVSGGAMRDSETSYLFRAGVSKRIDRVWLTGEFEYYPSNFEPLTFRGQNLFEADRARTTFSVVGVRADGYVNRQTEVGLSVTATRGAADFLETPTSFITARARVNYWATDRFAIFATADSVFENAETLVSIPSDRTRVVAGIMIRFVPPKR
jgi:hypothetical protein